MNCFGHFQIRIESALTMKCTDEVGSGPADLLPLQVNLALENHLWVDQILSVKIHWVQIFNWIHFVVWKIGSIVVILFSVYVLIIHATIDQLHGAIRASNLPLSSFMIVKMAKSSTLTESSGNGNSKENVDNFHFQLRSRLWGVQLKSWRRSTEYSIYSCLLVELGWERKWRQQQKLRHENISAE